MRLLTSKIWNNVHIKLIKKFIIEVRQGYHKIWLKPRQFKTQIEN